MRETKNHYPQIIQETEEFLNLFPNFSFSELKEFFFKNYQSDDLDERKFSNSLRMGFFRFNDYSDNLSYS